MSTNTLVSVCTYVNKRPFVETQRWTANVRVDVRKSEHSRVSRNATRWTAHRMCIVHRNKSLDQNYSSSDL